MSAAGDDVVHGLRAAARIAGRSPSGIEKLIGSGRLRATRQDGAFVFARVDLESLPAPLRASGADAVQTTAMVSDTKSITAAELDGVASTGVHTPIAPPSTGEPAVDVPVMLTPRTPAPLDTAPSPVDDGAVAAEMFGLFEAGRAPVEVVVSMKQAPSVVENAYGAWQRMKVLDVTSTAAQSRIAALESSIDDFRETLAQLTAVVDAHDPAITEVSSGVWAHRQAIDELLQRTTGLERRARFDGHADLRGLRQRLGAVEQAVRALPAAPLAIGVPCTACGHQLAVAASCIGCGAGRTALG